MIGDPLPVGRWFNRAQPLVETFAKAFQQNSVQYSEYEEMPVLADTQSDTAILLSHPLWMHDEEGLYLNEMQAEAKVALESEFRKVHMADIFEMHRYPQAIFRRLRA